jgi:hypothetical protein
LSDKDTGVNRKKNNQKRCRTTLFWICVPTVVVFAHGCAVSPKLTAEDRKKDIEYLAQWAKDYSPLVKLGEKHKGLPSYEALKPKYLELAEQAQNNEEFLQLVYGYFSVIGAFGHGYMCSEDEIQGYIGFGYDIDWWKSLRHSYWAKLFYDNFFVRPPFRLVSKGGYPPLRADCQECEYFTGDKWQYEGIAIPKHSKILKVNGMICSNYKDYLKKNTWLRYASGRVDWISTNELLIINEGENFRGWQVDFMLPDGTEVETFVPAKKGFLSLPVVDFDHGSPDNCICLELTKDVGYIRSKTFPKDCKKDGEEIRRFLNQSKGSYNKLIIDVRNNRGGLSVYFSENLIRPFLDHPITYKHTTGVRRNFIADKPQWYRDFLRSTHVFGYPDKKVEEVKTPAGFDKKDFVFYEITRELMPADRYNFNGDIFVLINGMTGSAAEVYADTIKRIKIATLVGRRTFGSASGYFQPDIIRLPASGTIFRVEVDVRINPDGSYQQLDGTKPDIGLPPAYLPEVVTREALLKDEWIKEIIDEL